MSPAETPSHPFIDGTADVILRAADGIEFRVHKLILSQASSTLERMLKLPQPESAPGTLVDSDAGPHPPVLPVVHLTETSRTVEHLLRLCYPMADPAIELEDFTPAVHAAGRYDMKWARKRLAKLLVQHAVPGDPMRTLRAFAVASNLYLPEAAELARATLREPLSNSEDLPWAVKSAISLQSLHRLMRYRSRVRAAVVRYLIDPEGWGLWIHKSGMNVTTHEWVSEDPKSYQGQQGILLWADLCRDTHGDRHPNYRSLHKGGGFREHVRIDAPYVIQELVTSTEELHNAFALQIPERLLAQSFDMVKGCEDCRSECMKHLREFFGLLEGALRDVMFEVPLDDPKGFSAFHYST